VDGQLDGPRVSVFFAMGSDEEPPIVAFVDRVFEGSDSFKVGA